AVEGVEEEEGGRRVGERVEVASPGRERVCAPVTAELGLASEADEREQVRADSSLVARAREHLVHRPGELRGHFLRRVLLEHTCLGLDDLAEGPEGHAIPVCEAASLAPGDDLRICVDDALELEDEAALAESRHADERDELRRSLVTRAVEGVAEDGELALAADELRAGFVRDVHAEP